MVPAIHNCKCNAYITLNSKSGKNSPAVSTCSPWLLPFERNRLCTRAHTSLRVQRRRKTSLGPSPSRITFCCAGNHMLRCRAQKCKSAPLEAVPTSCPRNQLFQTKNNFPRQYLFIYGRDKRDRLSLNCCFSLLSRGARDAQWILGPQQPAIIPFLILKNSK
jgi:hypothetical protein